MTLPQLTQTVTDVLVNQIRQEIIRANYPPGTRLRLRESADHFGVSIMPVREALQALQVEGIVTGETRKGMTVTVHTPAALEDIYEMRATLEELATRLAVPSVTDSTIIELEKIDAEIEQSGVDAASTVELNTRFHNTLYEVSGREHLCSNIQMLRNRTAHYFRMYMVELEYGANEEHRQIIQACRDNNPERSAELCIDTLKRKGAHL
ncbi:GntR family transcriptional regulator [Chloroflexi bacterium TSY]|nr:GntR family transcriptional regulator [Chloroflexi bacterium TSY]